jgi:hypothetical protein
LQKFVDIPSTDSLQNSRLKLMDNDKTVMSNNSGTSFPTNNLYVGMLCFRTDLNQLFELINLTPTWVLVADTNKTYTNKEYVDEKIANHGTHLPAPQAANNAVFLRNDGTYQQVTPENIDAARSEHSHNFPSSLPASGGYSDSAGYAHHAAYADNAGYAHSSGYAHNAGHVGGHNIDQIYSWAIGQSPGNAGIWVEASTQPNIFPGPGTQTWTGVPAGWRSVQGTIQELVNRSHAHSWVNPPPSNCNCGDGCN